MARNSLHLGFNYTGSPYELADCDLDARAMEERARAAKYKTEIETGVFKVSDFEDWIYERKAIGKKSDYTLFSMSSHGTQWDSEAPGENGVVRFAEFAKRLHDFRLASADRFEEGLCFWNGVNIEVLPDDDFLLLLHQIPGIVFVVLDSCFSGGMSREMKTAISRGNRMPRFVPFDSSFEIKRPPQARDLRAVASATGNKIYFLSASKENEVSWSTRQGGLFTRFFCDHYDSIPNKRLRTIKYLISETAENCRPDQTPNFVGYGGTALKTLF